jgi:hypothetical protein
MSLDGPQTLTFRHRFRSGSLCKVAIDLEAVRANTFRPHFHWNGRTHKAREFIGWVRSVFATVCERAQVPVLWCFVHRSGVSETWVFAPGEKPRRIKRATSLLATRLARSCSPRARSSRPNAKGGCKNESLRCPGPAWSD